MTLPFLRLHFTFWPLFLDNKWHTPIRWAGAGCIHQHHGLFDKTAKSAVYPDAIRHDDAGPAKIANYYSITEYGVAIARK